MPSCTAVSEMLTVGLSSSWIVAVPVAFPIVAPPVGEERVSENCSVCSGALSFVIGTLICLLVSPGANEIVLPDWAV